MSDRPYTYTFRPCERASAAPGGSSASCAPASTPPARGGGGRARGTQSWARCYARPCGQQVGPQSGRQRVGGVGGGAQAASSMAAGAASTSCANIVGPAIEAALAAMLPRAACCPPSPPPPPRPPARVPRARMPPPGSPRCASSTVQKSCWYTCSACRSCRASVPLSRAGRSTVRRRADGGSAGRWAAAASLALASPPPATAAATRGAESHPSRRCSSARAWAACVSMALTGAWCQRHRAREAARPPQKLLPRPPAREAPPASRPATVSSSVTRAQAQAQRASPAAAAAAGRASCCGRGQRFLQRPVRPGARAKPGSPSPVSPLRPRDAAGQHARRDPRTAVPLLGAAGDNRQCHGVHPGRKAG